MCCIDGPDIANGNITEWSKKKSCKSLIKLAKTVDLNTYRRITLPIMPPQQFFPEIRHLNYKQMRYECAYAVTFPEIIERAFRFDKTVADSKQFFFELLNEIIECNLYDFGRKMAKEIVDQKCFEVSLLPSSRYDEAFLLRFGYVLTRPDYRELYGSQDVLKLPCCELRLESTYWTLEELMDHVMKCGPYIPNEAIRKYYH